MAEKPFFERILELWGRRKIFQKSFLDFWFYHYFFVPLYMEKGERECSPTLLV